MCTNHAHLLCAMQVSAERARLSALSSDLAAEAAHAADERRRVEELQAQKAELEGALADAHARLEALAAGYGVSEALAEQERLREAVRLRDADVARLTEQAALQLDSYDMLEEIARRLAREAGHAPPAAAGVAGDLLDVWSLYPDTAELRRAIQSTVDRVRAANSELTRQNDALEEQRARLLKQLRVHAENMGDKSLRYYGKERASLLCSNVPSHSSPQFDIQCCHVKSAPSLATMPFASVLQA